tara:strand:+ start:141 stop:461 length:321 start_codon:yes stop_codon:yes gene_type:complete
MNYAIEILLEQKTLIESELVHTEGEERTELERRLIDTANALNTLNLPIVSKRCYVKEIDQFYEDTGYCDNTNQFGIRKDYKRGEGWDWKNPSQMIKDWMKWKRNNA